MAKRFVYLPISEYPYVKSIWGTFQWESGMAISQKQKSSQNLHNAIKASGLATNILECSRAGMEVLGYQLSAFNLPYFEDASLTVESIYQGSKVFRNTRTGEEVWLNKLYTCDSKLAKSEPILTDKNYELVRFQLLSEDRVFEANPRFAFYNYIYIKSIMAFVSEDEQNQLLSYNGFTDVMLRWYDGKVTSCQAHATAMYVGMLRAGVLDYYTKDEATFLSLFQMKQKEECTQLSI